MAGLSEELIEKKADELRSKLGLEAVLAPCMFTVLEKFQQRSPQFRFRSATTTEVGDFEAMMDEEAHTLILRERVIEDLKAGRERSRFTVAHELGHYILGHKGLRQRTTSPVAYMKACVRIEEQEANYFASCLLVPTLLGWDAANAEEISQRFQVSNAVAEIAFERIARAKRRSSGERRRPPATVIDFLKEAERRGHKLRSDLSEFD